MTRARGLCGQREGRRKFCPAARRQPAHTERIEGSRKTWNQRKEYKMPLTESKLCAHLVGRCRRDNLGPEKTEKRKQGKY
jgi:hypothetical protein